MHLTDRQNKFWAQFKAQNDKIQTFHQRPQSQCEHTWCTEKYSNVHLFGMWPFYSITLWGWWGAGGPSGLCVRSIVLCPACAWLYCWFPGQTSLLNLHVIIQMWDSSAMMLTQLTERRWNSWWTSVKAPTCPSSSVGAICGLQAEVHQWLLSGEGRQPADKRAECLVFWRKQIILLQGDMLSWFYSNQRVTDLSQAE